MMQLAAMLWKELIQVSNRRRFHANRLLIVAVLAAGFLLVSYGVVYEGYGGQIQSRMPEFGRGFFLGAVAPLTLVLSLIAMVTACGIVSSEVTRRRMPLLLVSPLGSGAIVGSKAIAVFAQVLVFFVAALPVFALLLLFGGVDAGMVAVATAFLFTNVFLYGCVGLAASVLCSGIMRSISLAVVLAVLWNLVPPFLIGLWVAAGRGVGSSQPPWLSIGLSPVYIYAMFAMARLTAVEFAYHALVNLSGGILFLAVAFSSFRSLALRRLDGSSGRRKERLALKLPWRRGTAARSHLADFAHRIQPGMLSRELAASRRGRMFLPLFWLGLIYGSICFISIVSDHWPDFVDTEFNQGLLAFESIGLFFLLSIFASTRIVSEKESATLQALALTRLGAVRILAGKAAGVILEQWLPLSLVLLHLMYVIWLGGYRYGVFMFAGFVLSTVTSTLFGLYFSLSAKKIVEAISATAVMWFLGPYVVLAPMFAIAQIAGVRDEEAASMLFAPILVAGAVVFMGVAVRRALKTGYGTFLAIACYALLSAAVFDLALISSSRGMNDSLMAALSFLPAASMIPLDLGPAGMADAVQMLPVQIGVTVWMAVACLANFDAQARRS